ncbi:unnamed protein product [Caenorhabditis auriculariae]|uniref:Uncharacterized protein n=1 Tax=Caenorhabditis auriculariae TaxID=2777116 RepID=A0A8S1H8Y9_9PELO|nr:unnamed protein product [Caenorhabditis auriculariae]
MKIARKHERNNGCRATAPRSRPDTLWRTTMASGTALKVVYGLLLIVGFLLTVVATFTPGWRSYRGDGAPDIGLVSRYCGDGNRQLTQYDCRDWAWHKLPFEKATLALMLIACLLEIAGIICFCGLFSPRMRLAFPAVTVTSLAFGAIFAAVLIFGIRNSYKVAYMQSTTFELLANVRLGYSYWLAVVGGIFMLFATGITTGFLGEPESQHLHH